MLAEVFVGATVLSIIRAQEPPVIYQSCLSSSTNFTKDALAQVYFSGALVIRSNVAGFHCSLQPHSFYLDARPFFQIFEPLNSCDDKTFHITIDSKRYCAVPDSFNVFDENTLLQPFSVKYYRGPMEQLTLYYHQGKNYIFPKESFILSRSSCPDLIINCRKLMLRA